MKKDNKKKHRRHRACLCGTVLAAGASAGTASAQSPLPQTVIEALDLALEDERQAHQTYTAILEQFGDVRPFSNIVDAEAKHIKALLPIYAQYSVPIPFDASVVDTDISTRDLTALCQKSVEAEIENVRLYDNKLLPAVADYPEIAGIFQRLRDASALRHLPAFQRCVARDGRPGRGQGRGRS